MIKVTKDLIAEQVALEKESKRKASIKALERSAALTKQGKGSQSLAGRKLHSETLPQIVQDLADDVMANTQNLNPSEPEFYAFLMKPGVLDYVRLEDMAHIALSFMLDAVGNGDRFTPVTSLHRKIGEAVEDQARFAYAEHVNPKFVSFLSERYFNQQTNSAVQNAKLELDILADEDPRYFWQDWDLDRVVMMGSWLVWAISRRINWFQVVKIRTKADRYEKRYLILSEEGRAERVKVEELAASSAYSRYPMLVPPSPWQYVEVSPDKYEYRGGYLLGGPGNTQDIMHGAQSLIDTKPSDYAVAFLNKVQDVAWKINRPILELLQHYSMGNCEIGAFSSFIKKTFVIPEIPDEVLALPETDERFREAKGKLIRALSYQKELRNKAVHPKQVVALAEEFVDRDFFFLPWFFDTRLRAYPLVTKLSPQGTDFQKALLLFAEGAEVTPENYEDARRVLLIGIATTWGNKVDKRSFEGRVEWAKEHIANHIDLLVNHTTTPEAEEIWFKADEPFQHIALLREYKAVFIDGSSDKCHVPVGFDATCSGCQLLGSFVRDETTCKLVNVLPSSEPQDAYRAVAEQAKIILSDKKLWQSTIKGMEEVEEHTIPVDLIDRSVAKKVVMLIPYGGSYNTLKDHVADATKDWNLQLMDTHFLTKALIQGMSRAMPGFFNLNSWFRAAAKAVMTTNTDTIRWQTAAGSTITQHYREALVEQIKTYVINKGRMSTSKVKSRRHKSQEVERIEHVPHDDRMDHPSIHTGWGEVLRRKNETALAANWTHSQDAAVLQLGFFDFDKPFSTVHDCLFAAAPVIPEALKRIKQGFVDVVTWDAIGSFIEVNSDCGAIIERPPIGDAQVEEALNSDYLFS